MQVSNFVGQNLPSARGEAFSAAAHAKSLVRTAVVSRAAVVSALDRCGKMVQMSFAPRAVYLRSISEDSDVVAFADIEPVSVPAAAT